jgi:hypothetical protein
MLAAIRLGIAIPAGHRPQSVAAFRAALGAAGLGEIPTLPLRERAGDAPTRPYFPPQKAKEPDTIRPPVAAPMPRRALSETVRRIAPTGDSARGDAGDGRTRPLPARPLPAPPVPARARSVPAASPPTAEPPPAAAPDDIPTVRIGPTARMGREAPPVLPPDPAAEVSAADGGAPGNAAQDHGAQDHGAPDRGAWGSAAEGLGPPVVAPPPPLPNLPTGDDKKTTVIYRRGRAEVVTAPVKPSRPEPPATDAEAAILPARFSVFHPMMLAPGQWHDAAVYLHEPGIDSFVRRDHMARFEGGAGETPEPRSALRYTLKPGAAVTVVPYLPGCRTNPPRATVEWWENFHRVTFRVMANAAVPGFAEGPAQGAILFFAGPLLVGEARLPYVVGREKAHPISNTAALAADTFDAVFPAYAPQDGEIADRLQALQGQVDSPYLAEMLALRAQDWDREILKRIEAAERFQLFWSPAAVRSPHLEEEWRFAHALGRDHFIRAFHWRHPAPGLPAVLGEAGVPLRHLALGLE